MIIRKAEEKDIPRILELLKQVLQIHADIRPDIFIPGTTKYTINEGDMHFVNYRSSPFQIIWCSLSLFLLMIYVSIKRLEASILAKVCLNM